MKLMNQRKKVRDPHTRSLPVVWCRRNVSVQVFDFSRVAAILQVFSRVFIPFLSWKRLISRRLWRNRGLNESQKVKSDFTEPDEAGKACTQFEGGETAGVWCDQIMMKIKRGRRRNHLTPALSPTKRCGGEGETISALVASCAAPTVLLGFPRGAVLVR
jgi:hypothetical protein